MNPILLDLGFIQIHWYSLTMLIAIFLAAFLFYKDIKKEKFKEEFLINLIFWTIIWGIVGARLYYVLFELSYYIQHPLEILMTWDGGLAIHGALIGGAIYIFIYCRKKKVNFLKIYDMIAPTLLIAQAIGRWGNFFNGEAHGPITTKLTLQNLFIPNFIIEGMNINGNYYHPTFYYEAAWNIIGFAIIMVLKKEIKNLKNGQLTGMYFVWYSLARFFIESLRTDSLMLGSIKIAQLVSILLFLVGLYLIIFSKKDKKQSKSKEK